MKFITNHLKISSILPTINNENDFQFIRDYLLKIPTIVERQITSRTNEKMFQEHSFAQNKLKHHSKWRDNIIIHYTHEARLQNYKKEIHQIWNHTFQDTMVMNTQLIVGTRNNPNTSQTLVRRRPQDTSNIRPNNLTALEQTIKITFK